MSDHHLAKSTRHFSHWMKMQTQTKCNENKGKKQNAVDAADQLWGLSCTIFFSCAFCSAVLSLEGGSPATKLSICSCNSTNLRCSAVSWDWFSDCDTCVASFLSFRFLFSSGSSLQNHLLILLTSSHHF